MNANCRIKGFVPASMVDWPGMICSVIFLGGCGFRCPACHNRDLVLCCESVPDYPLERILTELEDKKGWIDGVTVTGGEPTHSAGLPDLLRLLKSHGHKVKLDTNGSRPTTLAQLIADGLVDAVYMDVKAPLTRAEYSKAAGVRVDPRAIRRSIRILNSSNLEVVFRTTVVPGLVEEPELARIRTALSGAKRYIIQAFRSRDTLSTSFAGVKEFGLDRVEKMRDLFELPSPALLTDRYASTG
jgi:pyruvate formate lyase activating enzyme